MKRITALRELFRNEAAPHNQISLAASLDRVEAASEYVVSRVSMNRPYTILSMVGAMVSIGLIGTIPIRRAQGSAGRSWLSGWRDHRVVLWELRRHGG